MLTLITTLLIVLNLFLPLPKSVLSCAGIVDGPILGYEVNFDDINYAGNDVVNHFPIITNDETVGYIWVLKSEHILVFDHLFSEQEIVIDGMPEAYHPCGAFALANEVDMENLLSTYDPLYGVDSWEEYWNLTKAE